MSSFDTNNLQSLGSLSSYVSCIKSFGKPIISPLLTSELREEIYRLQAEAVEKEVEICKWRNECHILSKKGVNIQGHISSEHNISTGFNSTFDPVQSENRALCSSNMVLCQLNPSVIATPLMNDTLVSISKFPSNEICSTVHKGVIMCPNIRNAIKNGDTQSASCAYPQQFCQTVNPECNLHQRDHNLILNAESSVPYENIPTEQIPSISDDDQSSVTEETDFGSLPTVICANPQDTDSESCITSLTQSTDLEKYMNCSVEFSSPDDKPTNCRFSRLNMLSRSDHASSETLVNTESELTPCASTLSGLNMDGHGEAVDPPSLIQPEGSRAKSVDSYMKVLKTCARNLFGRKSQSEPCHSDIFQFSGLAVALPVPEEVFLVEDGGRGPSARPELESHEEEVLYDSETDSDGKKTKRRHVRSNSYTLDQPSPALIRAYTEWNHGNNYVENPSPSSVDRKQIPLRNKTSTNPAFKKEAVNIVLPPTPDRDKYFPILSSSNPSVTSIDSMDGSSSEVLTSDSKDNDFAHSCSGQRNNDFINTDKSITKQGVYDFCNEKAVYNADSTLPIVTEKEENAGKVSKSGNESSAPTHSGEVSQLNDQTGSKSSMGQGQSQTNDIQALVSKLFHELQESQNRKVNQLIELQSKQCSDLEEEFREEEKLLCSQFNTMDVSSLSGDALAGLLSNLNSIDSGTSDRILSSFHLSSANSRPPRSQILRPNCMDCDTSVSSASCGIKSYCITCKKVCDETDFSECNAADDLFDMHHTNDVADSLNVSNVPSGRPESLPERGSTEPAVSPASQSNPAEISPDLEDKLTSTNLQSFVNANDTALYSGFSDASLGRIGTAYKSAYSIPCVASTSRAQSGTLQPSSDANFIGYGPTKSPFSIDACKSREETLRSDCSQCSCSSCVIGEFHPEDALYEPNPEAYQNLNYSENPIIPQSSLAMWKGLTERIAKTPVEKYSEQEESLETMHGGALLLPNHELRQSYLNNNSYALIDGYSENSVFLSDSQTNHNAVLQNPFVKVNFIQGNVSNIGKTTDVEKSKVVVELVKYSNLESSTLSESINISSAAINTRNDTQSSQTYMDQVLHPSPQPVVPKQNMVEYLVNLKRRQSRDILKDPDLLKKFEKLPAFVKGYLTRRLFKTEKVQDFIKTLQDTAMLVPKLTNDLYSKAESVSAHEVELHRQLIVQLLTTFNNVYDIFCTISTKERMDIISESRNIRRKKSVESIKGFAVLPVAADESSASVPVKRSKLSAATHKTLQRRRSTIDNRTYTITDLKGNRPRIRHCCSSKSSSTSPSCIYKASVGLSLKRKTTTARKTPHWK